MFTCATYLPQTKVLDNATIISLTIAGQKNDMQPKYQLRKKQISVREWKVTRRAAHWCAGQSVMGEKHTTELAQNPSSWHSQKHKFKDASEDRRAQLARTESGTSSHCVPDTLLRKQQVPRCHPAARCKPWAPPVPGWGEAGGFQGSSAEPCPVSGNTGIPKHEGAPQPASPAPGTGASPLDPRGCTTNAFSSGSLPVPIAWEYAVGAARKIVQGAERYIKRSVSEFNASW